MEDRLRRGEGERRRSEATRKTRLLRRRADSEESGEADGGREQRGQVGAAPRCVGWVWVHVLFQIVREFTVTPLVKVRENCIFGPTTLF